MLSRADSCPTPCLAARAYADHSSVIITWRRVACLVNRLLHFRLEGKTPRRDRSHQESLANGRAYLALPSPACSIWQILPDDLIGSMLRRGYQYKRVTSVPTRRHRAHAPVRRSLFSCSLRRSHNILPTATPSTRLFLVVRRRYIRPESRMSSARFTSPGSSIDITHRPRLDFALPGSRPDSLTHSVVLV